MARIAKQCGVPGYLIAKMITTPADSMYWLTEFDLRAMGVSFRPREYVLALPGYPGSNLGVPAIPRSPPSAQTPNSAAKRPFRVVDVSDGFLQLRKGPGPQYEEVTKIPEGATIMVGRCVPLSGPWKPFCEVEWEGLTGWASSCCMAISEQSSAPTPRPPAQSQSQLEKSERCKGKAKGAQFFCILGGYDPAYCLEYRLRVRQVCEQE
jgi:hypothetical protein